MAKRRRRKLPNGFGSITELKDRKTKKFWARVTIGININGSPIRRSIGLFDSYNEAYEDILIYHKKNYNIDFNKATTEEIYNLMMEKKKEKYNKPNAKNDGKKTISRYTSTFNIYYKPIKKKIFIKVTQQDIQNIINNCEYGYDTKLNIKSTYNEMYKIAEEKSANLNNNFSRFLDIGESVQSNLHSPFAKDEIKRLWDNLYIIPDVDLVLISIYTGLRPSELCKLETIKIFLKEKYAKGGIKTNAGIDRDIPFCEKILPLIEKLYDKNNKYLLSSPVDNTKHISYSTLNKRFNKVFTLLNLRHLPHDGRHTLETFLASFGISEYIRNAILGHEQSGIGNKVYNHIPLSDKLEAINLMNNIC